MEGICYGFTAIVKFPSTTWLAANRVKRLFRKEPIKLDRMFFISCISNLVCDVRQFAAVEAIDQAYASSRLK